MTLYRGGSIRDQRPEQRTGAASPFWPRVREVVAVVAGLVAFVVGYGLSDHASDWLSSFGAGSDGQPLAVSTAPPDEPGGDAPRELIESLPVGIDDYGHIEVERGALADARREPIVHRQDGYLVEYTFDRALTGRLLKLLERGRVEQGHAIALDPLTGRVLAYVSTDMQSFPPQGSYPAASLVKIVTAAAALQHAPAAARRPCLYNGDKYRLTRSSIHRPTRGTEETLEKSLGTSNNRCFAQLAVESIGGQSLVRALEQFGWRDSPAPGHAVGQVDPGNDDFDLGRLGCGLSGCQITPLHAAQLAATLASGMQVTPWWIDRITDATGNELSLPARPAPRRVISADIADELRSMLVHTTTNGTARRAFRDRRGRPKLGSVRVAGKTGNLNGTHPKGRYEWFVGVAPAERPTIAVAVVQVQGKLWWSRSSEVAADLLSEIFCDRGRCDPKLAERFTVELGDGATPVLLSDGSDGRAMPASPGPGG